MANFCMCPVFFAQTLDKALQARIQKKLDEELPQEQMGGMKLGPKVSGNQGLSKS